MTQAYSKSSGYEKFSVHTNTKKLRFQIVPILPFSRIFLCGYVRCSVDGRPNRNNKVAFSNLSGIVWTRPNTNIHINVTTTVYQVILKIQLERICNFLNIFVIF